MVYIAIFVTGSILLILTSLALYGRCLRLTEDKQQLNCDIQHIEEEIPQQKLALEQKYENRVAEMYKRIEKENARLISQALSGQTADDLIAKINKIAENKIHRGTQEFLANISDEAEGLTRDLHFALSDEIWDSFQQYKEKVDDSPYVIPQNTRLMYTKGNRTIVLLEQDPQVRTLGFADELATNCKRAAVRNTQGGFWYQLALPYVYFMLAFDNGLFQFAQVFFSNKKIDSATNTIYWAPLPNVHKSERKIRAICMGHDGTDSIQRKNSIAQQCNHFANQYWQRIYNDDLGHGGYKNVDKRLKTLKTWQAASQKDPLFILSVDWKKPTSIKGAVESVFNIRNHKNVLDGCDQAVRKRLDDGVAILADRIQEEIESAKQMDLLENLPVQIKKKLEEVLLKHTEDVFKFCRKE